MSKDMTKKKTKPTGLMKRYLKARYPSQIQTTLCISCYFQQRVPQSSTECSATLFTNYTWMSFCLR